MSGSAPRVAIGLPVRNGEPYLQEAIDSLLAQTYADFELIIGDNASTDQTESICRAAARRDPRVRYIRHEHDLGAAPNFNRVFTLASSEYFHWAAHDDVWHPEHLDRSVEALDDAPSVVLSLTRAVDIDAEDRQGRRWQFPETLESADPAVRFRAITRRPQLASLVIFGLIRSHVLAQTALFGSYGGSDCVVLAELALRGPFRLVDGDLFLHREHPERSTRRPAGTRDEQAQWWDTAHGGRLYLRELLWLQGYARAISRAPVDARTRMRCVSALVTLVRRRRKFLASDVAEGARGVVRSLQPSRRTRD